MRRQHLLAKCFSCSERWLAEMDVPSVPLHGVDFYLRRILGNDDVSFALALLARACKRLPVVSRAVGNEHPTAFYICFSSPAASLLLQK